MLKCCMRNSLADDWVNNMADNVASNNSFSIASKNADNALRTYSSIHSHSEYSILDGACSTEEMAVRAKELNMNAIALTDHGRMAGLVEFYMNCRKHGVHPILGMEAYITGYGRSRRERVNYTQTTKDAEGTPGREKTNYHLILLAKNYEGYKNLCALTTESYASGFYFKPRIDYELLEQHHNGIICSSACILGEVSNRLLNNDYDGAKRTAEWFQNLFGEDYYLEVMYHKLDMERQVMKPIRDLADELGIKTIVTNDSHYARKEDHKLQKTLMLLGMHKSWADSDVRGDFFGDSGDDNGQGEVDDSDAGGESDPIFETPSELYMKSYDEMVEANIIEGGENGRVEQELANTNEIASKCDFELPIIDPTDTSQYFLPNYPLSTDERYDEFEKSGYEIPDYIEDACISELHKENVSEAESLREYLDDENYEALRFLLWTCEGNLERLVRPKVNALGKPLPMSSWIKDPPDGFEIDHAHNSPDELWISKQVSDGKSAEDIMQVYRDRLAYEISIIVEKRFTQYFLIVASYINYTRSQGSSVGPGRGSGAGSLINYLSGITSVDPITSDLSFERFLNPARKGYPDIDSDFSGSFRDNVLWPHLREVYGIENTSGVAAYTYYWGKAAIKAAARVLYDCSRDKSVPQSVRSEGKSTSVNISNALCNLIDNKPKLDLRNELDGSNQALSDLVASDEKYRKVIDLALLLQGRISGESQHASAYILSPHKITDHLPLMVNKDERKKAQDTGQPVENYLIQYDGRIVQDQLGYVKLDLLAINDLEVISRALDTVKRVYGCDIDIESIPLDDKSVYEMVLDGHTSGIFQFDGSPVPQRLLRDSHADRIADWSAINALNRPGPLQMGYDTQFVEGKLHPDTIRYFTPAAEKYLKDNYGVTCIAEGAHVFTGNAIGTGKTEKSIESIAVGDMVLASDGRFHRVLGAYYKGIKRVVRIRCDYGEELVCTPDHKIMTSNGWKEAGALASYDLVKAFSPDDVHGMLCRAPEEFDWRDWFIGLFIADGVSQRNGEAPRIACCSEDFARRLSAVAKRVFPGMRSIHVVEQNELEDSDEAPYYVVLMQDREDKSEYRANDYFENDVNLLLHEYGLYGMADDDKHLPSNYTLSMLIGLLEGNGGCPGRTLKLEHYALAKEVYDAMWSYGVHVSLCRGDDSRWSVTWRDLDGLLSPKLMNIDADQHAHANHTSPSSEDGGRKHWARVLSVSDDGMKKVYDLTVEDDHSFVCGLLTVSNCYQEDLMRLSQDKSIVGFTASQSDDMRKILAHKDKAKIKGIVDLAHEVAKSNNVPDDIVDEFCDIAVAAGSYSFNKSHALAYAIIAYRGAFIKAHFPEAFLAAMCTLKPKMKGKDKIPSYLEDARELGVKVLPPHVNYSMSNFDVPEKGVIAYGLGLIKNVGASAQLIIDEREKNGKYKDFTDFCVRAPKEVGKTPLTALIRSGALDGLGWSRMAMEESVDQIVDKRKQLFAEKEKMNRFSDSFFGNISNEANVGDSGISITFIPPYDTEYSELTLMHKERDEFGMYFDKDPRDFTQLSRFIEERKVKEDIADKRRDGVSAPRFINICEIPDLHDKESVCFIANVKANGVRTITTKTGKQMAFINVWDNGVAEESRYGFSPVRYSARLTVFPKVWNDGKTPRPLSDDVLLVYGNVNVDEEGKYPTSIAVRSMSVLKIDSDIISAQSSTSKLAEYGELQKQMIDEQQALGNPMSPRYFIPVLTFKDDDVLSTFENDPRLDKYMLRSGNVMLKVGTDDDNSDDEAGIVDYKIVHLKQTVGLVRFAEREYGCRVSKTRLPKAKRAEERIRLRS